MMKILVTGAAGFIGFHLCKRLLERGYQVVGLDNINAYYDPNLKFARLRELGISKSDAEKFNETAISSVYNESFLFLRLDLQDRQNLPQLFKKYRFEIVCNLAAQAGVRYSIENPEVYIDSNIVGFSNLLECCRHGHVKHVIYASSSSVYGENEKVPFSVTDNVDHPISLYAATKKANELIAHTYSHLFGIHMTGLRFFTVYGPWGRPDMAMFLFTDAILKKKPIKVFNNGNLERDFTFIDDIIEGVCKVIENSTKNSKISSIYNIGNSKPVRLMDFIEEIERQLEVKAKKEMLPMQAGDVSRTWADVESFISDYGYNPQTSVAQGVNSFISWYRDYYIKQTSCSHVPASFE